MILLLAVGTQHLVKAEALNELTAQHQRRFSRLGGQLVGKYLKEATFQVRQPRAVRVVQPAVRVEGREQLSQAGYQVKLVLVVSGVYFVRHTGQHLFQRGLARLPQFRVNMEGFG